jgi:hypothetical protein
VRAVSDEKPLSLRTDIMDDGLEPHSNLHRMLGLKCLTGA